ncbi:MAG: helix-hairpin-helix domain-containing protein [Planctomycetaceae bacterium]|nr:helix-hairpin-helix domain-containing protein [Planctomycetaceae bacterium]
MRLNFDLIEKTTRPPGVRPKRRKSDRVSVDDVWFDVPDEALEEVEPEPQTSLATQNATLSSRQLFSLWTIAIIVSAFCYFGTSAIQNASSRETELTHLQINVNSATLDELLLLEGVGELTAEKILADREMNGPFATPDDIQRVSGIGPKKLEKLRSFVRCND